MAKLKASLIGVHGHEIHTPKIDETKLKPNSVVAYKGRLFDNGPQGGPVFNERAATASEKKTQRFVTLLIFALIGWGFYSCTMSGSSPSERNAEDDARSCHDQAALPSVGKLLASQALRTAVRDPSSLEVISARRVQDHRIAGEFRARNGFGGYTVETYTVSYLCQNGSAFRPAYLGE